MEVKIGAIYRHYKGDYYEVLAIGKHTETGEDLVIYRNSIRDGIEHQIWIRPINMFLDILKDDIANQYNQTERFKYIRSICEIPTLEEKEYYKLKTNK